MKRKVRWVTSLVLALVGMSSIPAFAVEGDLLAPTDLTGAWTSGSVPYVNAVIPVVLATFGLFLGVGMLMRWGKRATR
jgi:hypothetical protein